MIGSTIVHLDIVDSTNNYAAKELLTKSLNDGTVFIAACQNSGKGQGGSSWESAADRNLTFSIVLYPPNLDVARQFSISKAIALGITDFLAVYIGNLSIKWPNDIYAGDQKIAGILIETAVTTGKLSRAIVGIGLNVNQERFVSDAPNPISLRNLTGNNYDLSALLGELCSKLDLRYLQLFEGKSELVGNDYESQLFRRGQWAKYFADGIYFEGMITGTDADGRLLILNREGLIRSFQFKEVQFSP
ncbi:MAG: biotin--[acetyl-CoA-carboxylase] ligase [Prolixibacteraceae bacterium]